MRGAPLALLALAVAMSGCSDGRLSPAAERGRQVYLAHCIACHNMDPAQPGSIGPDLKGSSEALLRAKVLTGTYLPGYKPKRPTAIMQPMPQLASDISNLAAYLR